MRWVGGTCVAHGEMRNSYEILAIKFETIYDLKDVGVGRIIKLFLEE
jgi:hypothetical protein